MGNKELFDQMAQQYDTPVRMAVADASAAEIRKHLLDPKNKTAVDFGCGTGLVGLKLADAFETILLVDAAPRMVDYVKEKIEQQRISNASAACLDIEAGDVELPPADYIIAVQVLLHIRETLPALKALCSMLKPEGHLLIVDFDKTETVQSDLVHNGFNIPELESQLKEAGFRTAQGAVFYHGTKVFMNQDADMFLLDATK